MPFLLVVTILYPSSSVAQDPPDKPDLIRVSVDHSDNGVLIQWEPSADDDIRYYHLYKLNADQAFERLFTFSASTLEYKHLTSGLKNLAYSVTAEDSTGNESLFEDNVHRAVSLSVEFDPCAPSNIISWSPYEGWEGEIAGYLVFGGPSGSSPDTLGFVSPVTLTFTHSEIEVGTAYSYYIETKNINRITSHSAIETVSSLYPDPPGFLTVDYVSVIDPSKVELQFTADLSGPIKDFRIMKRSNPATPFTEVTTILNAGQSTQVIEDEFPTSANSYEFKVQSIYRPPGCESPIIISESNSGTSILLGYELDNQIVTLKWNSYEAYITGCAGYIVQRRSGLGEFFDIQTLGPDVTSWSESVQSVINGFQPGELQYKILALGNPGVHIDPGISISNIVSVTVETHLKIPNAFTPGSNNMNFEFKPIIDFAPKDYVMIIVDRVGRKLYETTDPGNGWEGRYRDGGYVTEGVYVYYIQYTDYTGIFKSFTGNVTVLYP